jgi:uncharacterized membrane protein
LRRVRRAFSIAVGVLALATVVALALMWPGDVGDSGIAETLLVDTERAEVKRVEEFVCPGFQNQTCQEATIELETGPDKGDRSKLAPLGATSIDPDLEVGDKLRVTPSAEAPFIQPPGTQGGPGATGGQPAVPEYALSDFERRSPMLLLALVFGALVIVFGKLRGALSLLGLAISLGVVLLFVVPAILDGKEPLVVAVVGAMAVMLATITLAHGTGAKSLAAILGTALSLTLTVGLAVVFTDLTHLTGLATEEAGFLQSSGTEISVEGLLLAGMVIGALGVLDDVTISQSSTVLALRRANPALRFRELFGLAMRVGQDHVSATVNTLVLAYVGASLPVLLIFSSGELGFFDAANVELVAKEIVATLVGSIGLIAAVPITTALATLLSAEVPADELPEVHSH